MIEVNPVVAVVLFVALPVIVAGFGKLLLHLYDLRASARHELLEKALKVEADRLTALRNQVDRINQQLPLEYVRREDWIRFSASIDAKLDRLAGLIQQRNRGSSNE